MAYNNQSSYGNRAAGKSSSFGAARTGSTTEKKKRETLFSTGLFAPNKEGVKAIGSVQVKEAVTLPAGSYINLYAVDEAQTASGKVAPVYRIQVTEGTVRTDK